MTIAANATPFDAVESEPSDEEVVQRIVAGDAPLFEILMRRYNQRLFRVARGIVRSSCEAEDVVQETYVSAYLKLSQFAGRAAFGTWLTRIAVHKAFARIRLRRRGETPLDDGDTIAVAPTYRNPEQEASQREMAHLFEQACDALPEIYRTVFVMRGIEEMSTSETAACLDLTEEAVKVRFHRARSLLRAYIDDRGTEAARDAFPFLGAKCAGMVARVSSRLSLR